MQHSTGISFVTAAGIVLGMATCVVSPVSAQDAAAGQAKTQLCQACHGPDGNSTDGQYPRLAGQHADYLELSLLEYKSGKRKNAIMGGLVAQLTKQDIRDIAAYYSRQPGLSTLKLD